MREERHEECDRLRREIEELRESRMRLVLAADADRRELERELHDGVQQRLVALAVELQLVEASLDSDPAKARVLLEEIGRDVRLALDEAARLAERIYPPVFAPGGFASALRSAAAIAGIRARVRVEVDARHPPEVLATVYRCVRDVLNGDADEAKVSVRDDAERIAFEIVVDRSPPALELDRLRDRVEGLGGSLAIEPEPEHPAGIRVAGSLPIAHR